MLALRRNHLDATRERHVIALKSEEGTFSLNAILPIAYGKLYRESGPSKMAPLASIFGEHEQQVARSSLFWRSVGLQAHFVSNAPYM